MAGKWSRIEDVFPIKHGDIPASYVSLPEGKWDPFFGNQKLIQIDGNFGGFSLVTMHWGPVSYNDPRKKHPNN